MLSLLLLLFADCCLLFVVCCLLLGGGVVVGVVVGGDGGPVVGLGCLQIMRLTMATLIQSSFERRLSSKACNAFTCHEPAQFCCMPSQRAH